MSDQYLRNYFLTFQTLSHPSPNILPSVFYLFFKTLANNFFLNLEHKHQYKVYKVLAASFPSPSNVMPLI